MLGFVGTDPAEHTLEELIDELARVLHDAGEARELAKRAGFPAADLPDFGTARVFWSHVVRGADVGKTIGGIKALVDQARARFPGNRYFAAFGSVLATQDRASEGLPSGITGSPPGAPLASKRRNSDTYFSRLPHVTLMTISLLIGTALFQPERSADPVSNVESAPESKSRLGPEPDNTDEKACTQGTSTLFIAEVKGVTVAILDQFWWQDPGIEYLFRSAGGQSVRLHSAGNCGPFREDLIRALGYHPNILHLGVPVDSQGLRFQDGGLSPDLFAEIIRENNPPPQAVILASCDSFSVGKGLETTGIGYSIVSTKTLRADAFDEFATTFYQRILQGASPLDAFRSGRVQAALVDPDTSEALHFTQYPLAPVAELGTEN